MTDNPFSKFLPGFDFLQGLAKNAGTQMPGIGQWVAPTLNPEELDKRIAELRAVQFWLDQNAKMLSVTIQALEVQRMTLSTLKTMNVPMGDLSEALKAKSFVMPTAAAPAPTPAPAPASAPAPEPAAARKTAPKKTAAQAADAATPAAIDPLKWWGALSEQFSHLAAGAVKEIGNVAATAATPAAARKTASAAAKKKKA